MSLQVIRRVLSIHVAVITLGVLALSADRIKADTNLVTATEEMGLQPFLETVANGDVSQVKQWIASGTDVNTVGDTHMSAGSQRTALHWAIGQSQPEVCKILLEAGADPNRMAFGYETPLHLAFSKGEEEMAGWLLDYGARPFQGKLYSDDADNTTPFEFDITKSNGRLVARMLGQDSQHPLGAKSLQKPRHQPPRGLKTAADVLAQHGSALLQTAATRGEVEAVEALFKAGVTISNSPDGLTVMQAFAQASVAAQHSRVRAEQELHSVSEQLNRFPNGDKSVLDSLRAQARREEAELATLAPERWQKVLDLLVQHGAVYDALSATAMDDTNRIASLVSEHKAAAQSRDFAGNTALHWAVQNDRLPLVSFWIQSGAPLDATNAAGQTALHLAAADGKLEYVKVLFAAKAPTDIRDTNGWTPLDAAIRAKYPEIIHILMTDKSAPAHPERGFAITLHKAAENGDVAALAALLDTETNLEARNELGLTPLQVAVMRGHLAAAALLVDKGADIHVRDPEGNTLLHQVFLQPGGFFVQDRPPAAWLAGLKDGPHKDEFIKYLTVGQYEQGPNAILQETSFLLACGVDAQATNYAGLTVMQMLTDEKTGRGVFFFEGDRDKLFKLLAGAGGNVELRDADGNTALHRLCADYYDFNKAEKMASLIASGADINATNNLGQTPLHIAATNIMGWDGNNPPVNQPFQLLIYKKANVNLQDQLGRTPLQVLAAAKTSFKAQAIRLLLDAGADPKSTDKLGRTPVHLLLAAEWPWEGTGDGIDMLVAAGADLSARDNQGRTPLHYLASLGKQSPMFFIRGIGDTFVLAKVDFNARDNDGNTPLHLAAKSGALDVHDWLLKQGADPNVTNNAGETPRQLTTQEAFGFIRRSHFTGSADMNADIFDAVREGNLETVTSILKSTPAALNQTNVFGQTPLLTAAQMRRTDIVDFLDHQGARWDAESAVFAGRDEILRQLVSGQPRLVADSSLLDLAVARGDSSAVAILLAAGADVKAADPVGLSPLGAAIAAHHEDIAELLKQHGAVENIFDAAYSGDEDAAAKLITGDKALVSATNVTGLCVAELAAATGQEKVLELLLKKGVSANFQNERSGKSLLFTAVEHGQTNTANLLIKRGARVNDLAFIGYAPVHIAAVCGYADVLELLLKNKADVNLPTQAPENPPSPFPSFAGNRGFNSMGNTPLHLAAWADQTNTIALLLKWKASINARNDEHLTPLDLAKQPGPHMLPMSLRMPMELPMLPPRPGSHGLMQHRNETIALLQEAGGTDTDHKARVPVAVAPVQPLPALATGMDYHVQGCNDFNSRNYVNALANFRKSAELGSDYQDYTYYRIWILRSRSGEKDQATDELKEYLQNRKAQTTNDWPLQIGLFLSGQSTESNFLAAADSPDPQTAKEHNCEAYYYIGSDRLVADDKMGAVEFFKKCKTTGLTDFEEYHSADAELLRLEFPVPSAP